jgi:hypothetical protein
MALRALNLTGEEGLLRDPNEARHPPLFAHAFPKWVRVIQNGPPQVRRKNSLKKSESLPTTSPKV